MRAWLGVIESMIGTRRETPSAVVFLGSLSFQRFKIFRDVNFQPQKKLNIEKKMANDLRYIPPQ